MGTEELNGNDFLFIPELYPEVQKQFDEEGNEVLFLVNSSNHSEVVLVLGGSHARKMADFLIRVRGEKPLVSGPFRNVKTEEEKPVSSNSATKFITLDERLEKIGLSMNPKYPELYPIEVLGVYGAMSSGAWDIYDGNPETYIDKKLTDFVKKYPNFKNTLKSVMDDSYVMSIFFLRMNYAYLLEPGEDSITVHRNNSNKKLPMYGHIDDVGNYHHDEIQSSVELLKNVEELDKRSNAYYSESKDHSRTKTGTEQSLRDRIHKFLESHNCTISHETDAIYHRLNHYTKQFPEFTLISRLLFLAFKATSTDEQKRIT